MAKRVAWTPEKIEEVRRRYPHEDTDRLAAELGCSHKALVYRACILGVHKTDEAKAAIFTRVAQSNFDARHDVATAKKRRIATGVLFEDRGLTVHLSDVSGRGT